MIELPQSSGRLRLVMGNPVSIVEDEEPFPLTAIPEPAAFEGALFEYPRPLPPPTRPPGLYCDKQPGGYLVNVEKRKALPSGCMAWSCRKCARFLAYRVVKRLEKYEWTAKVEFTLDGDGEPTKENNLRLALGQRRVLQFVRRYFKRKYGDGFKLRYARMHGIGESGGRLHSHMVWDAPFIPQEVLSEHAEGCGLGFRVYIRAIDRKHAGAATAVRYVADQAIAYVARQSSGDHTHKDLPRGARRFQSSGVQPYVPEPGWHWQECYPCFEWDPKSAEAGRRMAEWLQRDVIELPNGQVRIPVGIERTPLGFKILSSLVYYGGTASPRPAETAKPIQLLLEVGNGGP